MTNQTSTTDSIEIKLVADCLTEELSIPAYQRPYKWNIQNIDEMLQDIYSAIQQQKIYSEFRYRLGTIILHKDDLDSSCPEPTYNIVDGQQRLITLSLISRYLDKKYQNSILATSFSDPTSQANIYHNFQHISEWFSLRKNTIEDEFRNAMATILEVVVIYVKKESEAFQLFDSQNARGKALDPHDLLKAYHLREMHNDRYEMEYAVNQWEMRNVNDIRRLFGSYLFHIWNWSRGVKSWNFTDKDINTYKGITLDTGYTYAKRASNAMPFFQITEPIIAGRNFFDMTEHYLRLLSNIRTEVSTNPSLEAISKIYNITRSSTGMQYAKELFECALLFYYDKFHVLDELAIKKIFIWAYSVRVDVHTLGRDTINKYAVGERNDQYSNFIPMFSRISLARKHTDISNLQVNIKQPTSGNISEERNKLYESLKKLR